MCIQGKTRLYSVEDCLQFQASTGGLGQETTTVLTVP